MLFRSGLSTSPENAHALEAFVPADRVLPVVEAVVRVFNRMGNRQNKSRARLKYVIRKIGMDAFRSTLCEVRPQQGFVDETVLEDTRFLVSHELHALPSGGTRVTYAIQVEGPEATTLGPLVTADFPEVLAALKALAERAPTGAA